jgi:WD40 repeat protein
MDKKAILIMMDDGTLYSIDGNSFEQTSYAFKRNFEVLAFDENTNNFVAQDKNIIYIYSLETNTLRFSFPLNSAEKVHSLLFASNEILIGSGNGSIKKYNSTNANLIGTYKAHEKAINNIRYSSDKKIILTASEDGTAALIDPLTGSLTRRLEGKSIAVEDFSLLEEDHRVLSLFADSTLKEWEISDRVSLRKLLDIGTAQGFLSIDEQGKLIVTSGNNQGKIIDRTTKAILKSIPEKSGIKKAIISSDGHWVAYIDGAGGIKLSKDSTYRFSDFGKPVKLNRIDDFTASKKNEIFISEKGSLITYYLETGLSKKICSVDPETIGTFAVSQDGSLYAVANSKGIIKLYSSKIDTALFIVDPPNILNKTGITKITFSKDNKYLAFTGPDLLIHLVEIEKQKETHSYYGHTDIITNLRFTSDGNYLMSSSLDNTIRLWMVKFKIEEAKAISNVTAADFSYSSVVLSKYDEHSYNSGSPVQFEMASFIALKNEDWIIITPDRYYFCNKNAAKELGYNKNGKYYSFEQFDLKYNRPDIVLNLIGVNDSALINAYKNAYYKRLRKMGFTEEQLNDDLNLPEIKIKNFEFLPSITDSDEINFQLEIKDEKYTLNRLNCWVNGIAIFGKNGLSLSSDETHLFIKNISIHLLPGMNNIRFSVLNSKGVESYKTAANIEYRPIQKIKSNLYLIAISVSEYNDQSMNLRYAVKDGRDIIRSLSGQKGFEKVSIDTFFNKTVSKEIVKSIKEKLLKTTENDEVILFISGHGMLDKNLDFYFATPDMDFNDASKNGISYDALEDLLDSIPARKKLLLMDACHSGEIDKDENIRIKLASTALSSNISSYEARSSQLIESNSKIGLENSFEMMQELFAGVNKGSGTIVISAAAGKGFAFESAQWNNGVFSYCLMNGILSGAADKNKDKQITARELLEYVSSEVEKLTRGAQKPTSRKENFEYDWVVWRY